MHTFRYARAELRLFSRRRDIAPDPAGAKPFLITIHAEGDQYHTFAMGPGDGVGFGGIRVDISEDGQVVVSPVKTPILAGA